MSLDGRRVLVMGGGSGIGEATAARFAAAGAEVVITGRTREKLAAAAERIGGKVTARQVDATSADDLRALFADEGSYDHLVLAVSSSLGAGPVATLDLDELRAAFDGKYWAHLRTLQAALPRLRRDGSVTFIGAASAQAAMPGTAGLAAINGALEAMVPPLAAELAPLRVNAVSPGVIDTPWWSGLPDEQRAELFRQYGGMIPAGRVGRPEEVADAVVAMATNGYVTGSVLVCAGGAQLAVHRLG
ncbi:MAG TPA: SDR family oxidoreductase [Streptosporangiales bacterium]